MKSIHRLVLSLFAIVASCIGATLLSSGTASATLTSPLLPGEPVLSSGQGAYAYGYNNGPEWAAGFSAHSSVQQAVRSAGLTLDRIWGADNLCSGGSCSSTTATGTGSGSGDLSTAGVTVGQKIAAMHAAGGTCMLELFSVDDLNWLKSMVSTYGNGTCPYFEWGNEPDNGGNISDEVTQWNADIPTLKALCTAACYFGGPAPTWSGGGSGFTGSTCGLQSSTCNSDIEYFLAHTTTTPDFITFHMYTCNSYSNASDCLSNETGSGGDIAWNWNNALTEETDVIGHTLPTVISEFNYYAFGTATWQTNSFLTSYQANADAEIQTLGIPAVNFYTMQDNSAGEDFFSDTSPYSATTEFTQLASDAATAGASATSTWTSPPDSSFIDSHYCTDMGCTNGYSQWAFGLAGYLEEAYPGFTVWYHHVFVPYINYENSSAGGSHGYANGDSTQPTLPSTSSPCTTLPDYTGRPTSGPGMISFTSLCYGIVGTLETESEFTAWLDQHEHEWILGGTYNASPSVWPATSNLNAFNE